MCKPKETTEKFDYHTTSVHIARIVGKVRTYLDVFYELIKQDPENRNDFLSLIANALYDLIIIETSKLIDKNEASISLFHLMEEAGKDSKLNDEQKREILDKKEELANIFSQKCELKIHRNKQKAHSSNEHGQDISRFIDFAELYKVLDLSEELVKKYNLWIRDAGYSISFDSTYVGGHKNLLKYISSIKF